MKDIYITIYTKEQGKLSLTIDEWNRLCSSFSAMTYHREDGPASESMDGIRAWYINGECHREDGPAVESDSGYESWHIKGSCHREDGPARTYVNPRTLKKTKYWYLDDRMYPEHKFKKIIKKVDNLNPVLGLTDSRWWVRERFKRKLEKK